MRVFAGPSGGAGRTIDELIARVKGKENDLTADLQTYARQLYGRAPQPVRLDAEELAASGKVPINATPLEAYFNNRESARPNGELHGLMRAEVFNVSNTPPLGGSSANRPPANHTPPASSAQIE